MSDSKGNTASGETGSGYTLIGFIAVLLAVSFGLRGCWADGVKDREVARQLRLKCAAIGGSWTRLDASGDNGCYSIRIEPLRMEGK